MIFACPGSKLFKQPVPEEMKCPCCGQAAELWSDEASALCAYCGNVIVKRSGQSCLDWCKHAKQCMGKG